MGFSRKLLNQNEDIVLDLRPHWFFFLTPILVLVGGLLVIILMAMISGDNFLQSSAQWVGTAALVVALVWGGWRYLEWINTNFVVTTDRVIYRSGVFAKRGIQIPLERVNNVLFEQNILERLLGAGDLLIESAGEEGRQYFNNVRHPDQVQNVVYQEMEENENRKYRHMGHTAATSMASSIQSAAGPAPSGDTISQLERLEGLKARGAITQEEYDAQKAALLGGGPATPPAHDGGPATPPAHDGGQLPPPPPPA